MMIMTAMGWRDLRVTLAPPVPEHVSLEARWLAFANRQEGDADPAPAYLGAIVRVHPTRELPYEIKAKRYRSKIFVK